MEEQETCEMHEVDKLGRVAVGGLVRTKNKVAVNPFAAGVALVSRAHKMGTHFGYGTRQNELQKICENLGDVALIRISVDYNTTRISSVHGLLWSEIRLHRALQAYELQHKPGWEFNVNGTDWVVTRDFEGVLKCTQVTATLAQIEKGFMGAYTCLIKSLAMSKLRAATMSVIDMGKIGKSP
jgi:hypothetical protein